MPPKKKDPKKKEEQPPPKEEEDNRTLSEKLKEYKFPLCLKSSDH